MAHRRAAPGDVRFTDVLGGSLNLEPSMPMRLRSPALSVRTRPAPFALCLDYEERGGEVDRSSQERRHAPGPSCAPVAQARRVVRHAQPSGQAGEAWPRAQGGDDHGKTSARCELLMKQPLGSAVVSHAATYPLRFSKSRITQTAVKQLLSRVPNALPRSPQSSCDLYFICILFFRLSVH